MSVTIKDVQGATGPGNTNPLTLAPFATDPVNGDTIVVVYGLYIPGSPAVAAPTDSEGNTYTQVGTTIINGNAGLVLWQATNIIGGSSFEVTGNPNGIFSQVVAWALDPCEYFGDFTSNTDSTDPDINSTTSSPTPVADAIFIGAATVATGANLVDGTGWNTTGVNGFTSTMQSATHRRAGSWPNLFCQYKMATAGVGEDSNWTSGPSGNWSAIVASFAPPSGASSAVGTAAGTSSATAEGLSIVSAAGTAAGLSAASAVGVTLGVSSAVGSAAGVSSAAAVGLAFALVSAVGSAAGLSAATAVGANGATGGLFYAWTQISGPDTATIVSPSSPETDITFPEVNGVYLFQLEVSRNDALVGVGIQRVAVFTDDDPSEDLQTGPVTLTVNGDQFEAIIESTRISKSLGSNPSAGFRLYSIDVPRYSEVIVERGSKRLFGGVCMSSTLSLDELQPFFDISLIGYSWHLHRKRFTKKYIDMSISDIVADILVVANVGIDGDFIQAGMPTISISFTDIYPDDALTTLMNRVHGHWKVDDFRKLHSAVFEASGDPIAISPRHPWYRDLTLSKDATPSVNRVIVSFTNMVTASVDVDSNIPVDSLDGYDPAGGDTVINGTNIHYTGVAFLPTQFPVFNYFNWAILFEVIQLADTGTLTDGYTTIYYVTFVTDSGESPAFTAYGFNVIAGGNTAFKFRLTDLVDLDPGSSGGERIKRIRGFNVYKSEDENPLYYIGTIPAPGGGALIDGVTEADRDTLGVPPPTVNRADDAGPFLTGCTGTKTTNVPGQAVANNTAAQIALAALFGGTDDGVIETELSGGNITPVVAQDLAEAYLGEAGIEKVTANVTLRDDDAQPGQILSINLPDDPHNTVIDLKIQSAELVGFELGVPHTYHVTAARDVVTLQDLMKTNTEKLGG